MAIKISGTTVIDDSRNATNLVDATISGDLTFSGTGSRIIADMSDSAHANRLAFQTSVTDGNTDLYLLPNGTSISSSINVTNASDPTNCSRGRLLVAGTTDVRIASAKTGTGTHLPLTFYASGGEQMRIDTTGNVGIGTTNPTVRLDVSGSASFGNPTTSGETFSVRVRNGSSDGAVLQRYSGGLAELRNTSGNLQLMTASAGSVMTLGTVNTERMRINSTGNVGIGTSVPGTSTRLHLKAAATTFVASAMENTNGGTDEKIVDWLNNGTAFSLRLLNDAYSAARTAYDVARSGYTPTTHRWLTAASGDPVERVRINSSGNVGIGTISPAAKLDVSGEIIVNGAAGGSVNIEIGANRPSGTSGNSFIDLDADDGTTYPYGFRILRDNTTPPNGATRLLHKGTNGFFINTVEAAAIVFSTTNLERVRITSGGNVGIGTSSPGAKLHVNGTINCGSTGVEYSGITGASSNKIAFLWGYPNLNGVVDNALSVVVGTASDHRLKANVTDYQSSLVQVMNLRPVTYNPKELGCNECDETQTHIGLIAHEVSELFPFLVSGEKDATSEAGDPVYQSINYAGLTPILVKALQEQQAIIEALEARVAALET